MLDDCDYLQLKVKDVDVETDTQADAGLEVSGELDIQEKKKSHGIKLPKFGFGGKGKTIYRSAAIFSRWQPMQYVA